MNDIPNELAPEMVEQIRSHVSGVIGEYHNGAQDLRDQADALMERVKRENEERLRAAAAEAQHLRDIAMVKSEVARQLQEGAQKAAAVLQSQPPAAAQPGGPRTSALPSSPQTLAGGPPSPAQGLGSLREALEGEQGPPQGLAGPAPGGGAPFRGGQPPQRPRL